MSYHEGSEYGEKHGYGKNDYIPKKGDTVKYVFKGKKYTGKVLHCDNDADVYQVEFMPSTSIYLSKIQLTKV